MQNKLTFEYAIIRLVPKVEREEFINVGVILFSKRKKYLGIRYHVDPLKIKAFTDEVEAEMIEKYLQAWEWVCEGKEEGGPIGKMELASRFRWLVASRSTIIQSSKTHPGLCTDPEKVLMSIFKKYVL